MRWRSTVSAVLAAIGLVLAGAAVHADPNADKAEIIARLRRWAAAFNARDAAGTCDLFAPDLISTVPGSLNAGRDTVCARLGALLAKPDVLLLSLGRLKRRRRQLCTHAFHIEL